MDKIFGPSGVYFRGVPLYWPIGLTGLIVGQARLSGVSILAILVVCHFHDTEWCGRMNHGVSVNQAHHPRSVSLTTVPGRTVVCKFSSYLASTVYWSLNFIGYFGIDQSGCEGMGCCWSPKEVSCHLPCHAMQSTPEMRMPLLIYYATVSAWKNA